MRRTALLAILLLAACASGGGGDNPKIIPPEVELRQLVGPADLNSPRGPIQVQYELFVKNESSEELQLTRIELETMGSGGYALYREPKVMKATIAPNDVTAIRFYARALARGNNETGSSEPVTIRGIVYFDSPFGPVRRIFMRTIPQGYGSRNGS